MAVAVGAVRPLHGVGGVTAVIFHNAVSPHPLAQLGNMVGRCSRQVENGQKEGPSLPLLPGPQVRDIHLHGDAHIGLGHGAEVVKLGPPGVGGELQIVPGHGLYLQVPGGAGRPFDSV